MPPALEVQPKLFQLAGPLYRVEFRTRQKETSRFRRNVAHRIFGQRRDGQARIYAGIGGHDRAIDHVQPRIVEHLAVHVDHAVGGAAPIGQPPKMCAVVGILSRLSWTGA